jgi:acyl-CoA synthetase (AMP-forming)/AMP-acid ligase II
VHEAPWNTIAQLVDDAAGRFPDLEAVVEEPERWTFPELATRVHGAVRALMATGIQRGDRISIWAPNIREWVVVALAVHCAGAVLVPINTRFKSREALHVLNACRARLVFTVSGFLDTDYVAILRDANGAPAVEEIIILRGDAPAGTTAFESFLERAATIDDEHRAQRSASVDPDDLCHILFTSGTTGAPKGAMLTHAAICEAYSVFCDVIGLRAGDRYLVVLPFFHSFGLNGGILCCLMRGATIVPDMVFDASATMRRVTDEQITVLPGAPTIFQTMLNHPDRSRFELSSLRLAVIGAAAIPVQLVHQLRDELGIAVVTGYGITESSGIVTMCRHDDDPDVIATTVGRPLPGLHVRIVDDQGHELPSGEPGEILVRGYTIMRGYLDDPAQTAATIDADGWLHTGDIGVLHDDDTLQITDRLKDMFTVGGFNVYPAEIENVMSAHTAIAQVAVIGIPDSRLGEVGMAYVVRRSGARVESDEIKAWCREQMANYKVPRVVEFVDALPINATGKVLKFELRAHAAATAEC